MEAHEWPCFLVQLLHINDYNSSNNSFTSLGYFDRLFFSERNDLKALYSAKSPELSGHGKVDNPTEPVTLNIQEQKQSFGLDLYSPYEQRLHLYANPEDNVDISFLTGSNNEKHKYFFLTDIRINPNINKRINKIRKDLNDRINNIIGNRDIKHFLFYSLDNSDFVLIIGGKSGFNDLVRVVEALRDPGRDQDNLMESTYSIPFFRQNERNLGEDQSEENTLDCIVKITIKKVSKNNEVCTELASKNENQEKFITPNKVWVSPGNHDIILQFEKVPAELIIGLADQIQNEYKDDVDDIQTQLLFPKKPPVS